MVSVNGPCIYSSFEDFNFRISMLKTLLAQYVNIGGGIFALMIASLQFVEGPFLILRISFG